MVRRHGWQLPAHPYQVVAITVFFLLSTAFYVFLAPFLGSKGLQYSATAIYSSVTLAVFLLYVRCTAIDPSDPGIFQSNWKLSAKEDKGSVGNSSLSYTGIGPSLDPSASGRSSLAPQFEKQPNQSSDSGIENRHSHVSPLLMCLGFMLGWFVKSDNCKKDTIELQTANDEDVLFCTLCNVEVRKFSKHCRSCDKCVDGFDHHCRWLNNCVGRKNYVTFVSLMATCLVMLLLDCVVGLAVLVRCFTSKADTERLIVDKLGNGFSRPPFIVVIVICTLVPLLASIPLGELLFFHIILIRKGITTYEYVVAMRAQNEPQVTQEVEQQSAPSSPTSSTATGLSGSSSLGLQVRGAWCTPPRVFVDHQEDEVIPHLGPGRVPSTVDPDATTRGEKSNKPAVRISAWKLAKLDPVEAARAAREARKASSVLRPAGFREGGTSDLGYSSSSNASVRSSMSADYWNNRGIQHEFSPRTAYPASRATSKEEAEAGGLSRSSLSSPGGMTGHTSAGLSPLPLGAARIGGTESIPQRRLPAHNQQVSIFPHGSRENFPTYNMTSISPLPIEHPSWGGGMTPGSDGGDSSGADSLHERQRNDNVVMDVDTRLSLFSGSARESRSAVYWDREAGRFISVPNRNHLMRISNPFPRQNLPVSSVGGSRVTSTLPEIETGNGEGSPQNVSDPHPPGGASSQISSDNLTYSGTSIFFGGPLSVPISGGSRNGNLSSSVPDPVNTRERDSVSTVSVPEHSAPVRGSVMRNQSPIFVPPRVSHNNPLLPL